MQVEKPKLKTSKQEFSCANCGISFRKYQCQIKTQQPCCSIACSRRIPEYRQNMARTISNLSLDQREAKSKRFYHINQLRKGKTFKEIYGQDKARKLLEFYSQRMQGKKNFNYIDGRSYLPYPTSFNKILKLQIKSRDGFMCVKCGLSDDNARTKDTLRRGLTIHHIDFDKNNCQSTNLITTCKNDNTWANWHREESIAFYQNKILERAFYA